MTRDEAIKVITSNDVFDADLIYEAVSMAIKALEQEPKTIEEKQAESEKYQKAFDDGYENGYAQARFDYEQEPCEDCISRQAVIDVIERWLKCSDYNEAERHIMRAVQSVLYDSPSVKPQEPKTGRWIVEIWNNKEHHTCSSCQHIVDYEPCYHYCPYCGAKMESEES